MSEPEDKSLLALDSAIVQSEQGKWHVGIRVMWKGEVLDERFSPPFDTEEEALVEQARKLEEVHQTIEKKINTLPGVEFNRILTSYVH